MADNRGENCKKVIDDGSTTHDGITTSNEDGAIKSSNKDGEVIISSKNATVVTSNKIDGIITSNKDDGVITSNKDDGMKILNKDGTAVLSNKNDAILASNKNGVITTSNKDVETVPSHKDGDIVQTTRDGGKMCGYLEKRGKLGVTGRWRSWYCVLDGHLLLQYKSQAEYLSLSPCRGSINLALARTIQRKPKSLEIHIATRSQLILLKAMDETAQTTWLNLFIEAMTSQPQHSALTLRLNNHQASFRGQASGEKNMLKLALSEDNRYGDSDLSDKQSPIISTDGQITFIDEDDFEEDELNDEKKENVEVVIERKINVQDIDKNVVKDFKENNQRMENNNVTKILKVVYKKNCADQTKKDKEESSLKCAEGIEVKAKVEKRSVIGDKINRLSKVIEEQEETISIENEKLENLDFEIDIEREKETVVENSHKNEFKSAVDNEKKDVDKNSNEELINDEIKEKNHIEESKDENNFESKRAKTEVPHSPPPNSLVPIVINEKRNIIANKQKTDEFQNSDIKDHFDLDEHKTQYQADSLLYLHDYLKTYIDNNYEVMRAFNKKDKYLNQKIKINNNKHNRKHLKNILLCQCKSPCCSSKGYNVQTSKMQGNPFGLDSVIMVDKPKGKYVWFQDPESEDEDEYSVYENFNVKELEMEAFDGDCVACLEEKRNVDAFDGSCLECIEEYKQKCLKERDIIGTVKRSRFKNVHPDRIVKNKALKLLNESKKVPKRASSEIVCKNLKLKYERNHSLRKKIKRHGIRFDLHDQLAPISYNRIRNGPKIYDKSHRSRRYSEELLYTAYLDLELRRKFPDLSKANNRLVKRSSSLLVSTQSQYIVKNHSKNRFKNTDRTVELTYPKTDYGQTNYQCNKPFEEPSDEIKEYDSIINQHINNLMYNDETEDKPDRRTIDELLEEVKQKEKIEQLYILSQYGGNKNITPKNKNNHHSQQKSSPKSHKDTRKETVIHCDDGQPPKDTKSEDNNVIGKNILHQKTNPLIELLFENSKSSQYIDTMPKMESLECSPSSESNQKTKLDGHNKNCCDRETYQDQNNNTTKEHRQSRVLDHLFENQRNSVEAFRLMCNSNPDNSQIGSKEASKENKSRKIFSFNFKRKSPTKHLEPNLERPISLQNLHDMRYAENGSKMIEDYRRPNSLQRLNETAYQNASIHRKPNKHPQNHLILERPNSLQRLNKNVTQNSLLGRDLRGIPFDDNLIRQRSASLDQFHRREPQLLTRNTSFLHNSRFLTHRLSTESGKDSVNDRTVKRSRSLIQRLFPLGRNKKSERKKQEEKKKARRDMVHASPQPDNRRQMPLPDLPPYDIPDPDYNSDSHEGIYEELDPFPKIAESPSNNFTDESRPPPIPRKDNKMDSSATASSSGESSRASSGYCTKNATPDVDYYTDRTGSLLYDIPRTNSTSSPGSQVDSHKSSTRFHLGSSRSSSVSNLDFNRSTTGFQLDPSNKSNPLFKLDLNRSSPRLDRDSDKSTIGFNQDQMSSTRLQQDSKNSPTGFNQGSTLSTGFRLTLNRSSEPTRLDEVGQSFGNSQFFLDYVDSLDACKMRLLQATFPLDPDSLDSSGSSTEDDRYHGNQHGGYSSDDEAPDCKICPDSLLPTPLP